jgi:hypothetical protein
MPKIPGAFVPLYVNYDHDVAIRKAGPMAELLYIRSLVHAKRARSAGFVSRWDLDHVGLGLRSCRKLAQTLVTHGLWEEVEDGWCIRSWGRWNSLEESSSAGGKRGNHVRWHLNEGITDPRCAFCASEDGSPPDQDPIAPRSGASIADIEKEKEKEKDSCTDASTPAPRVKDSYPEEFEEFWALYPRKEQKPDALKAWKATRKTATAETLIRAVRGYRFPSERQYTKLPAGWLRKGLWMDVPGIVTEPTPPGAAPRPLYDASKLPAPNELWSDAQVDMVLGPDTEPLNPPAGMDEDAAYAWVQNETRKRKILRRREAQQLTGWRYEA